ncbi:hypothetical protein Taro_032445 [Colocasia esculenta]|uniref:Uncharacterized protein n=1 Tax=Colocasia esculenta TaxID=4460 RepID=A0A843VZ66_COLES|nr:hypothetical protein [Colocasia esculenta]
MLLPPRLLRWKISLTPPIQVPPSPGQIVPHVPAHALPLQFSELILPTASPLGFLPGFLRRHPEHPPSQPPAPLPLPEQPPSPPLPPPEFREARRRPPPLQAAAGALPLSLFSSLSSVRIQYKDDVHNDGEVMRGTINVITRIARSMNERLDAVAEVERYKMKVGIYGGYDMTYTVQRLSPAKWWI